MIDVPILCFHPPTPPSPTKTVLQMSAPSTPPPPPTPPASPPQSRPPPPSLEPDGTPALASPLTPAPSDALENMDIDDDVLLETPPAVLSHLSLEGFEHAAASIDLRLGTRDAEREREKEKERGDAESCSDSLHASTPPRPSTPSVPSTPASLIAARSSWLSAQTRRASASARGEFKIPKHEEDWAAAEAYVSSLEDSLMALYRCLEDMELDGQPGDCQGQSRVVVP